MAWRLGDAGGLKPWIALALPRRGLFRCLVYGKSPNQGRLALPWCVFNAYTFSKGEIDRASRSIVIQTKYSHHCQPYSISLRE